MVNDDRSRKSDDNEPEVQETIGRYKTVFI